ncbi:hypothetical protein THZB04_20708 [Vibrio owensii]|nr:hypothetical protein THZB04_20708 [Vibrio owensii]
MVKQSSLTPNEYLHIKTLHLIVFFTKNLTYNQFKSLKTLSICNVLHKTL